MAETEITFYRNKMIMRITHTPPIHYMWGDPDGVDFNRVDRLDDAKVAIDLELDGLFERYCSFMITDLDAFIYRLEEKRNEGYTDLEIKAEITFDPDYTITFNYTKEK